MSHKTIKLSFIFYVLWSFMMRVISLLFMCLSLYKLNIPRRFELQTCAKSSFSVEVEVLFLSNFKEKAPSCRVSPQYKGDAEKSTTRASGV